MNSDHIPARAAARDETGHDTAVPDSLPASPVVRDGPRRADRWTTLADGHKIRQLRHQLDLKLAQGYTAADKDGIVSYTAHELRHVCASLLIASGASDTQVAHQMGHSKVETTKNIYGHLFAQDRSDLLNAMNEAVSRLHVYEDPEAGGGAAEGEAA